jgi:hypothetical protein
MPKDEKPVSVDHAMRGILLKEKQMEKRSAEVVSQLLESYSVIEAFAILKNVETFASTCSDRIKYKAALEADGIKTVLGVPVEVGSRTTWDYLEDPELQKLGLEKAAIAEKIIEREAFLRSLKAPVIETTTGLEAQPAKVKSRIIFPKISFR